MHASVHALALSVASTATVAAPPPPRATPVPGLQNTFSTTNGKPMRGGRGEHETTLESGMVKWPSQVVSWWYAANTDSSWKSLLTQINQPARLPLVTSIMSYCGHDISDDGSIVMNPAQGNFSACKALFPELVKLGVRPELATGAGNCSIVTYRKLWRDTTVSPQILLKAALEVNASGWNIDLEPQGGPNTGKAGWGCQGGSLPIGNAADAKLFASWLTAVRAVLSPHRIRLTADVASWSPVLKEYKTLAPAVDRLQTMSTYNSAGLKPWTESFHEFVDAIPSRSAGVGLGMWNDSKREWWETAAGAKAKVAQAIKTSVVELACFRLVPCPLAEGCSHNAAESPISFWWDALAPFVHKSDDEHLAFNFSVASFSNVTATTSISLVGSALEDINFSLYGGLYSQLIFGESFEEPALQGLMPKTPLKSWRACAKSDACHATWAAATHSRSELTAETPHTGKQALRLTAAATKGVSNMGLGRWGLNLTTGVGAEGLLFLRTNSTGSGPVVTVGLCPAHDDGTALPSASECYATTALLNEPVSPGAWVEHTFALTPSKTDGNASFVIWLGENCKQVDVDDVMLEPATEQRWRGQHVRKDMAQAMLLERAGGQSRLGFARFGGDAADASTYSWRNMRGPAVLRPPRTPGSWDPIGSNGFGLFEFLQMREAAGIPFAVLDLSVGLHDKDTGKCGHAADSPADAADMLEYMLSTSKSSALAQLRAQDGHPLPYKLEGLIFEVSNECTAATDYFTGSLNRTISTVAARAAKIGGAALVKQLQFGSMGDYDWQDKHNTKKAKALLITVAQFWQRKGVQLYSDQHMGGGIGPGQAAAAGQRTPFPRDYSLQVLRNYSSMRADIAKQGGGLKMYVGEEDCAADKNEANDAFCHAHWRGLTHALLNSGLARLGGFVNGNGPCNTFGASGRQVRWPQAMYEFSKAGVLKQPPALIQGMLAESFGLASSLQVIGSSPERFSSRADNTSVLDLLVLKNVQENSLSLRVINSWPKPVNISLSLPRQATDAPNVYDCTYLTCELTAVNSWQQPQACYPQVMPNDAPGSQRQPHNGVLTMTVPPFSFTVCISQPASKRP